MMRKTNFPASSTICSIGALSTSRRTGIGLLALHRQPAVADRHHVQRPQHRAGDRIPIHQGPVGRSQVLDHQPTIVPVDGGMLARDVGVVDAEIGLLAAAEHHAALRELLDLARRS